MAERYPLGMGRRRRVVLALLGLPLLGGLGTIGPAPARAGEDATGARLLAEYQPSDRERILLRRMEFAPPDVKAVDADGFTALHDAAAKGYVRVAEALLALGAKVESRSKVGTTPLLLAARNDRAALAELLLARGAEVDGQDARGSTPLLDAAAQQHLATVRVLAEHGASIDAILPASGKTALLEVLDANEPNRELVRYLLQKGASPSLAGRNGRLPLELAGKRGDLGLARELLDAGAEPGGVDYEGTTVLVHAIYERQAALALLLLEQGAPTEPTVEAPAIPLAAAAYGGHAALVRALLARGASVDAKNADGQTSLHQAASKGHVEIVQMLLDAKATVNAKDRWGATPLDVARHEEHEEAATLLAAAGGTSGGTTAGFWWEVRADVDLRRLMRLRVASGQDPLTVVPAGVRIQHFAVEKGLRETLTFLVKEGRQTIGGEDDAGRTPLDLAIAKGDDGMGRLLVELGHLGYDRPPYLQRAAEVGLHRTVKAILGATPLPKATDAAGRNALHAAAGAGRVETAFVILATGRIPVDEPDGHGRTALHRAALGGHRTVVRMLLTFGADPRAKDAAGKTPRELAQAAGKANVVADLDRRSGAGGAR